MKKNKRTYPISEKAEEGFVALLLVFGCSVLFGVLLLLPGLYKLLSLLPVCIFVLGMKNLNHIVRTNREITD